MYLRKSTNIRFILLITLHYKTYSAQSVDKQNDYALQLWLVK